MRPDRMISDSEAKKILQSGKYGILSTVSSDGVPYGVPVNYFYIPEDNALYFHCALKGRKLDNITSNSKVSFVVTGKEQIVEERFTTYYESVIIAGTASVLTDEEEKREKLVQLCEKLAPTAVERRDAVITKQLPAVAIVKVTICEITGKRNQS